MTLEASRLMVLAMTPPQPSSSALPMTLAFVPGGPEPMMKGFGSFRPFTVVASVGISPPGQNQLSTNRTNLHELIQFLFVSIREIRGHFFFQILMPDHQHIVN